MRDIANHSLIEKKEMLLFDTRQQRSVQRVVCAKSNRRLDQLQTLVGGYIEALPHPKGHKAEFTAYANEEGMVRDLPSNFLAWGVLYELGFRDPLTLGFYYGNIVLLGRGDKPLTEAQMHYVEQILNKYLKDMGEVEKEEAKQGHKRAREEQEDPDEPVAKVAKTGEPEASVA